NKSVWTSEKEKGKERVKQELYPRIDRTYQGLQGNSDKRDYKNIGYEKRGRNRTQSRSPGYDAYQGSNESSRYRLYYDRSRSRDGYKSQSRTRGRTRSTSRNRSGYRYKGWPRSKSRDKGY